MGGDLTTDNETRRVKLIIFFIAKEENGGSMKAWESQLEGCRIHKTAPNHRPVGGSTLLERG